MKEFDQMIKELSREMEIPEDLDQCVQDVLQTLPESSIQTKKKNPFRRVVIVACVLCVLVIAFYPKQEVQANIFEQFRLTIMDIFHLDGDKTGEELGVDSNSTDDVSSKPELFMEMKESIIDGHNIYLLVKITASSQVVFDKETAFDYFAFCMGENYNADQLIGGAKDCYLLETMEGKENVATYVVNISSEDEIPEDAPVTVYFKDLERNPFSDNPEMVVEGMWSMTFAATRTVRDELRIEGTEDMQFPYLGKMADVKSIELTALGLTVELDVSGIPYEELGVSDTRIDMGLEMSDGSKPIIAKRDYEGETLVDMGSCEFNQDGDKSYQRVVYNFKELLDLNKVVGMYIEDVFIPMP